MKKLAIVLAALLGSASTVKAEETSVSKRPGPREIRSDEDWSELQTGRVPRLPLDGLKYIDAGDDVYLTLGGQLRFAYELFINERYGEVPQDDSGSFLLRMMPHANFRVGRHFRVFAELKSTHEAGRDGGPTPLDVDRLDVHQFFVEASIGDPRQSADPSLSARVGRQELYFGEGRLVDVRDGPSVRRSFDTARLRFDSALVEVDALIALEVPTLPGVFDDGFNDDGPKRPLLWGGYAQTKPIALGGGYGLGFDLYYLGVEQADLIYFDGVGEETRHSFGGRWWIRNRFFRHELEGAVQRGELEDPDAGTGSSIQAWGVEGTMSYTWADTPFRPSIGIGGGAQSGDTNPGDGTLGTYRAPFPNLRWVGAITGVGPGNGFGGNITASMSPIEQLHVSAVGRLFFRLSLDDVPYSPAGFPLRVAPNSDERHVGTTIGLNLTWRPHPYVMTYVRGEVFEPGGYLEDAPPAETAGFATIGTDLKF